jgi:uncharacterized membrane protein
MENPRLNKIWDSLQSSYWFIPTLMAIVAVALAFGVLTFDRSGFHGPFEKWGWIYTGGPEGARATLSVIAGSMVSVTATAFSITIVALQLAASNFGPRLLRNFMQDKGNQFVLGMFIATFIYCLLVLRTIRGEGDGFSQFVPQISVTISLLLAIASIGVLIYFIHHASTIIQVSNVIAEVSADLDRAVERLFPEKLGRDKSEFQWNVAEIPVNFDKEACPIRSTHTGYIQGIDNEALMNIACDRGLLLRLQYRPGKFIIPGSELVMVWPAKQVNRKLADQINDAFILGRERNEQQDIEFPLDQLVEIALRAISPGINDPFTALRCIDRLSAGLCQLVQRDFPSPYRYDDDGNLRVIAKPVTFAELTDVTFNPIRRYSSSDIGVRLRLLEAIAVIASFTRHEKDRAALLRHAKAIERDSQETISEELDRQDIRERYLMVIKALEQ